MFLCVTALAPWMLPTPGLVVLGSEPDNRFGSRTHVAQERPEVSMAGFRHEQGCRDAVLAQMGQRTVAQLVKGPLPSRCFTEQKTTPAGRTAAPGRRGFDPARPGGSYSSGTKRLEKSTCCASAPAATFTKS